MVPITCELVFHKEESLTTIKQLLWVQFLSISTEPNITGSCRIYGVYLYKFPIRYTSYLHLFFKYRNEVQDLGFLLSHSAGLRYFLRLFFPSHSIFQWVKAPKELSVPVHQLEREPGAANKPA